MKYIGKLILEGIVVVAIAALVVVAVIYFLGDKLIKILGG